MRETQKIYRGVDGANLCALVFSNGRTGRGCAMTVDDAVKKASLPKDRFKDAIDWSIASGWIRQRPGHMELTAAGIFVAKVQLDLER